MDQIISELNINLTKPERQELLKYIPDTTIDQENFLDEIGNERSAPISTVTRQEGRTDSKKHNKTFEDIYLDLFSLFLKSTLVYSSIEKSKEKSMSILEEVKQKLKAIEKDVFRYKFIVNNDGGFTQSYQDLFYNYDNMEEFESGLYFDPDTGHGISQNTLAQIHNGLRLNTLLKITPETIRAQTENQSGEHLIADPDKKTNINNIFSSEDNKVWSENILADKPFDLSFDEPLYFEKTNGALCKISLILENSMPINYITMEPFSEQPFEIISITAYDTLDTYFSVKESENPLEHNGVHAVYTPEEDNKFLLQENIVYSFSDIEECKVIDIAIKQENYRITRFFNALEDIEKINLMNYMFEGSSFVKDIFNTDLDSTLELDFFNSNNLWSKYSSFFKKLFEDLYNKEEKELIDSLITTMSALIPGVNKYQLNRLLSDKQKESELVSRKKLTQKFYYQYGFKNIDIGHKTYTNKSIYISKPFDIDSNVKEVALNVNEHIPKKDNQKIGFIKYFVTNKKTPARPTNTQDDESAMHDWYPILPEGKSQNIELEPVVIKEGIGKTNFPYQNLTVYTSPAKKEEEDWEPIDDDPRSSTKDEFKISTSITKTVYCSYQVQDGINPYIVDFDEVGNPTEYIEGNKKGETFQGTCPQGTLELSYFPYINYNRMNNIIEPENISSELNDNYVNNNPNIYQYNPNFQQGYRPLKVTMLGSFQQYNKSDNQTSSVEGIIKNDNVGLSYKSFDGENIYTRFDDLTYHKPYFYNKTNYSQRQSPPLLAFDPKEHPVFEYAQNNNFIYFNKSLDGEITVEYDYLVENLRVKIVIYKFIDENISPTVNNYLLKSRDFHYHPGGFSNE